MLRASRALGGLVKSAASPDILSRADKLVRGIGSFVRKRPVLSVVAPITAATTIPAAVTAYQKGSEGVSPDRIRASRMGGYPSSGPTMPIPAIPFHGSVFGD